MIPGVRTFGLVVILPLVLAGAACQLTVDLDTLREDPVVSSTGSQGGAGGDGAGGASAGGAGGCLCLDPPPEAWDGYFFRSTGAPGGAPGACDDRSNPIRLYQGAPGPVVCNACSCGPPAGATCAPPLLTCNESADCTGPIAGPTSMLSPGCNDVPGAILSCQTVSAPAIEDAGSCAPSGGGIMRERSEETWQLEHRLCAADFAADGCPAEQVCATAGADESLCIRRAGIAPSCPAGYGDRLVVYQSASDTRDCTPCSCGTPLGLSCEGGGYTFYDSPWCEAAAAQIDASCSDVSGSPSVKVTVPVVDAASAQCPSTGGDPSGIFEAEGPVTLCCR